MTAEPIVIKLGGTAATDTSALDALMEEMRSYPHPTAVVHGGGKEVSELSRRLGIEPVFADGVRMTSEPEMDVVEMVLSGLVNKRLVRRCAAAGVRAVGVSGADGGLVTGTRVASPDGGLSRTATVTAVDPALIRTLWTAGFTPVVSSPASDASGVAVNINADDVAFALAGATGAGALVFLSDVDGVMIDGCAIDVIRVADIEPHISCGAITGGMIPKVRNAVTAVARGVGRVIIGNYRKRGDLARLLGGASGTRIEQGA